MDGLNSIFVGLSGEEVHQVNMPAMEVRGAKRREGRETGRFCAVTCSTVLPNDLFILEEKATKGGRRADVEKVAGRAEVAAGSAERVTVPGKPQLRGGH